MALLKYWKLFLVGLLVVALLGQHIWFERKLTEAAVAQQKALADQQTKLTAQCTSDKQLTSGVDNGIQKGFTARDDQLSVFDQLRPSDPIAILMPSGISASIGDGKAPDAKLCNAGHSGSGIKPADYRNLLRDAETVRIQVIGLQSFICQNWAANGQPLPEYCQ